MRVCVYVCDLHQSKQWIWQRRETVHADQLHTAAALNWIAGLNSNATKPFNVPALFGLNYQVRSAWMCQYTIGLWRNTIIVVALSAKMK